MKKIFTILALLLGSVLSGYAATYIVINTNDSGVGSLRQAITDANANAGADIINFNVSGAGPFTISPTSALPSISGTVTIDALTQPGASAGSPNIVLNGATAGANVDGLTINTGANNSVVKGLVINGFSSNGITINGNNNSLVSCFIGTDVTGTSAVPNKTGILVLSGTGNIIGGGTTAERNIISGNTQDGVYIFGSTTTGNTLKGNYIGTNAAGMGAVANGFSGVSIAGPNNTVGGTATGDRNVISGNTQSGVSIFGSSGTGNTLKGNYIGTNAAGTGAVANSFSGVTITSANNIVGGSTTADRNVLSGNTQSGVFLTGIGATGNSIKGNYIGLDALTGPTTLGNNLYGVSILDASNNTIGGTASGERNFIVGNNTAGVRVTTSATTNTAGNSIRGNNIQVNNGLGIDLGVFGVNANDAGDGDTGANDLQNYPVITGAYKNAIVGTFNSTPSSTFTLDFYSSVNADPSGYGEGVIYLGSTTVTTDGSGNATYNFVGTFTAGRFISTTATNAAGSTSEFGLNQTVQDALPVSLLSFKATATKNNRQALLEWITSVEINNERFEVERSDNALDWKRLGVLSGKGNNTERAYYTYTDESPLLATNYYRLKQIDFDGTHTYSQIKALSFEEELSAALVAYPNPTNGTVTITLNELIEVQRVGLYNLSGNQLSGNTQSLSPNKVSVDLSNLPTGTYLVNYGNKSVKIMRQ